MELFREFFSADGFMPHGHCYLWNPSLVRLHVLSDFFIAAAYFSIPFTLFHFVRRRRDLPFNWMFICFGVFIVSCGLTHVFEIITLWKPYYWLSGGMKVITALASVPTAILLITLVPKALQIPGPASLHDANRKLRKAEGKISALLESAPDATVTVTADGAISRVNSQTEKLFGYTREELFGQKVEFLMPQRFREKHPGHRAGFLRNPHARPMGAGLELFGQRKDGTEFPVEISLSPLETEEGMLTIAAIRDISERKRAESELQAAKEEADRANQAKSDFLSRMSHELRTPLNAILGFSQLLQRDSPTPAHRARVQHIIRGGHHLLNLINEVLDISRIEAGNLQVSLEPVRVGQLLQETLDLVRPLAAERAIELAIPFGVDGAAYVLADSQRLKQVLLNLLSNAVKYTPLNGNVTISFSSSDQQTSRISVKDTGIGISREKLPRLFTPFERLGAEQTNVEGAGLGLALSQRLMQAMGGCIGVESTLGQGSTFWVELLPAEPPENASSQETTAQNAKDASTGKRTVLYIEDNLRNLTLVRELLTERPGIQLLTAMQGKIGLDLAREHSPDLVLLDLDLPDMTGGDLLSQLQDTETTRQIPVVVISADATAAQIDRFKAAGVRDYLTKPFDVTRFFELVDETANSKSN